ncbi:uncharacterized protein LOC130719036 [Lotus japonicus]|uniref:uncharacterized protein LOC130719036 n=1 Tax=Lotus japonicus TaxID=34305 RepID=UPI002585B126|nr:uncharacterized protein LOC130719036 [Lotus japonicus]
MKILSFNVRGLGGRGKMRVIREVVCHHHVEVLFVQETKLQRISTRTCAQLWGESGFDWKATPAVNRGGGLLCIWNPNLFVLEECVEGQGFIGLVGVWKASQSRCVLVNIYSATDMEGKRALWNALTLWRANCTVTAWCLASDFNVVRVEDECRGCVGVLPVQRQEMEEVHLFISTMELQDIPLAGRRFTWRRPNNQARTRLDRFLVSNEWDGFWPNCSQLVLNRDISDPCPLLLR